MIEQSDFENDYTFAIYTNDQQSLKALDGNFFSTQMQSGVCSMSDVRVWFYCHLWSRAAKSRHFIAAYAHVSLNHYLVLK